MNKKIKYLLLANLVLGSMLSLSTVFAEEEANTAKVNTESSTLEETEQTREKIQTTTEPSIETEKEVEVEEPEEEVDYDFGLPTGRSDLAPRAMAFSARGSVLSITDETLPTADFIDISSHNGELSVAEFRKIKSYGVTGVIIKLTEFTNYQNPYAQTQIKNAKAAGLKISAYHYSWFMSPNEAKQEATYFANFAAALGLPKSTIMVNDIEDHQLKASKANHTENSQHFENILKAHGYSNVSHYMGLHWINENKIKPGLLGYQKTWVAAYPYTPSQQEYTQYGAWQWASNLTFPGVRGVFDISSDYAGIYSEGATPNIETTPGPYIADGRYVTVTNNNYDIYSNFNWSVSGQTNKIHQKTYQARGRYEHSNGLTYYTMYDSEGTWQGYLDSRAVTPASGPQGIYQNDGRYVEITEVNQDIFNDFSWSKRDTTSKHLGKSYQARGRYEHFNGETYYSVYDNATWIGYVNATSTKKAIAQGKYISDGSLVVVIDINQPIYSNFDWSIRNSTGNFYQKTLEARGRYEHLNGKTYYSIYNGQGTWLGYIDAAYTKKTTGALQGSYIADGSYVKMTSRDASIYQGFDWKVKAKTKDHFGNVYQARGRYEHFNGSTYYSLYNAKGKWIGYVAAEATTLTSVSGPYIADGRYVTVTQKNKKIYNGFSGSVRNNSSNLYMKTFQARGRYEHFDGDTYYSVYDATNRWQGYFKEDTISFSTHRQGSYIADGREVKISNPNYTMYSNFNWNRKNSSKDYLNQTVHAKGRYQHFNGATYYSLYTLNNQWLGYINADATRAID